MMKIKTCCQIILLIVFVSLLSINAWAQDEGELKLPVEVKLTTQTIAPCIGTSLLLELEMTNNGRGDFTIRKSEFWRAFSFGYLSPRAGGRAGGLSRYTGDVRGVLLLHPGESYRDTFELPLSSDFFYEAGHYTLKTNIDYHYSNEVEFELYDCGKPQEVKEQ